MGQRRRTAVASPTSAATREPPLTGGSEQRSPSESGEAGESMRSRGVEFDHSPKVKDLQARLTAFMEEHIYPNEKASMPRSPRAIGGSRRA